MKEFIITFRECLEASLIIGILLTFLQKSGEQLNKKFVWYAVGWAVGLSLIVAFILKSIENSLSELYAMLFEGLMLYSAAGFLIYMIVWMAKNSNVKQDLENKAKESKGNKWAIFGLSFFAVMREGFETALFLYSSGDNFSYFGFFAGIILAVLIGFLIFSQGSKVPLKTIFNVSSIVLIFFAAGMVAYGTHEFEEYLADSHIIDEEKISRPYDILKPSKDIPSNPSFYNLNDKGKYVHVFHDKGTIGENIKAFLGYNSNPNWPEFILYFITLFGTFFLWNKTRKPQITK